MSLPVDSSTSGNAQLKQNPASTPLAKKTSNAHLNTNNLSLDYMSLHFNDTAVRCFYDPNTKKFTPLGHEVFGKWNNVSSKIPTGPTVKSKIKKPTQDKGFLKI